MSPQGRKMTSERRARLQLGLIAEAGDPRLVDLLARFGPEPIIESASAGRDLGGIDLPESWVLRSRRLGEQTAGAVERARRSGMRFLCPGDDEWPVRLADLDHGSPIGGSRGQPLGLWVRGPLHLARAVERSVSIVGARDATTYGLDVASDLAADVSDDGAVVVSGAAFGIDSAAHRGALAIARPTLAVLACGADVDYPRAHAGLLARIAESGIVMSEQAPGQTPTKGRFLTRNRIIAALTVGTVIVEAARRSGALNTVNWAADLGRVVMGVPGPVTSQASVGVHQSIRAGQSIVVTNGREVLEAIDPVGRQDATLPWAPTTALDQMPGAVRLVLEAVRSTDWDTTGDVAARVGCTTDAAAVVLDRLAEGGWVARRDGRWRLMRRADLSVAPAPRTVTR